MPQKGTNELNLFLKGNKQKKENTFYAATKSLKNEKGEPLQWEIRKISTKEHNKLRDVCVKDVPVVGKKGFTRPVFDGSLFEQKMLAACIVYPELNNKELQDSYEVLTPEDLLLEMIDEPFEFTEFSQFVSDFCGFDVSLEDKVEEAKN